MTGLFHRNLLATMSGGGGGGGGGNPFLANQSPSQVAGVSTGDLVIFGQVYRDIGASSPGEPNWSGVTKGSVTTLTANKIFDGVGTSRGSYSMYWALAASSGDLVVQTSNASNRLTYGFVVPGYSTIVQSALGGADSDTTPESSLSSAPTGPVLAVLIGGGAPDATAPTAVTADFVEQLAFIEANHAYKKYIAAWYGFTQTFGCTVTANQVSAGGSGIAILEIGTA